MRKALGLSADCSPQQPRNFPLHLPGEGIHAATMRSGSDARTPSALV